MSAYLTTPEMPTQKRNLEPMPTRRTQGYTDIESIIDYVPPMLPPLGKSTFLKVLEDNDAVIHMCIKSRAPKMRHLARTLRIDLDWLFERFQTDPAITITYINTKSQLADIFTKACFTGVQWGVLLDLIQIRKTRSNVPLTLPVGSDTLGDTPKPKALAKNKPYGTPKPMMNVARFLGYVRNSSRNSGIESFVSPKVVKSNP